MTFRTALITGASRGIGAAIATRLAQDGYAVALNYASRGGEAEALAAGLREQGGRAIAVQGDVADAASAASLFDRVEAEWGGLDVLVNNAGVLQTVPLANASDTVFDQMMEVNVRGVFNTLRLAAQRLRAGGAIVNVSSTLVATNLPGYGIYVATKAAVEGFTRVLAKELRGRDITVNAVAPGPVATELFFTGKTPEQIATFTKAPPLERLGEPVDIANVVGFLAGPDGRWVHGQVVRANGGLAQGLPSPMLESLHALYAALAAKLPALGPWLAPLAFVLAFVKSLPLVALFIPGTALLLSIGAAIRLSEAGFVDVWLAISLGAALGDWVSFALGVWAGPRVMHWNWLRQRPHMVLRAAAFVQRWGVLSIVLCRFFGPLRATVPLAAGVFGMRAAAFQAANWSSALLWAAALLAPGWLGSQWLP